MNPSELDDELCRLLKSVVDHFEQEDLAVRQRQVRHWRRLKLYWNNFSQIYWGDVNHDWKIWDSSNQDYDSDQAYYDKPVNVYRAFLEVVIAALSVQIPAIVCVPDDADNTLDVTTAKGGNEIAKLTYKHNDAIFLWLNALYIYCTEGLIACHNYSHEADEYGTYQKPKFKDEEVESYVCTNCGSRLDDSVVEGNPLADQQNSEQQNSQQNQQDDPLETLKLDDSERAEFDPDDDDVEAHDALNKGPVCPTCLEMLDPELQKTKLIVPRLIGYTTEPKSRICIEMYGGLYVKVANYAKSQCDTPYLRFAYETHYANALEKYPKLRDRIPHGGWSNIGVSDPYEQMARLNPQYRGEFPLEVVTESQTWLRPSAFNILNDEDYKKLKRKFPDGAKVCMVNNVVADYCNQNLDDHWTLTRNPLSDYLNHEPLGELLTNIQDIVNDLISLTLQTIEHGIEQTWVDPAVVSMNGQSQIEATPGVITPTKPVSASKNISEAFYTTKAASLSPEIFQFYRIVQELGQFVSGALPSIFGGSQGTGTSRTASEYAMSKNMALQRLNTPWKMLNIMWKTVFSKVIPMYIKCMVEDERYVKKDDSGNFINVSIRRSELEGKIGAIELESDDKLPISDEQIGDMILQLLQLNNDQINGILLDPENLPQVAKVTRIPQLQIPGDDDRVKQHEEIKELLQTQPITVPPDPMMAQQAAATGQMPQPTEVPSVDIDPDVDNHTEQAEICRAWAVSDAGRLAKVENPQGYKNVLLHMKLHLQAGAQEMQAQLQMQGMQDSQTSGAAGAVPSAVPKQPEQISESKNVRTPIE